MVNEPARTTRTKLSMVRKRSIATPIVYNGATISCAFVGFNAQIPAAILPAKNQGNARGWRQGDGRDRASGSFRRERGGVRQRRRRRYSACARHPVYRAEP